MRLAGAGRVLQVQAVAEDDRRRAAAVRHPPGQVLARGRPRVHAGRFRWRRRCAPAPPLRPVGAAHERRRPAAAGRRNQGAGDAKGEAAHRSSRIGYLNDRDRDPSRTGYRHGITPLVGVPASGSSSSAGGVRNSGPVRGGIASGGRCLSATELKSPDPQDASRFGPTTLADPQWRPTALSPSRSDARPRASHDSVPSPVRRRWPIPSRGISSEHRPDPELNPSRAARRQDLAERRRAEERVRQIEVGAVEQVERFGAQLEADAASDAARS